MVIVAPLQRLTEPYGGIPSAFDEPALESFAYDRGSVDASMDIGLYHENMDFDCGCHLFERLENVFDVVSVTIDFSGRNIPSCMFYVVKMLKTWDVRPRIDYSYC